MPVIDAGFAELLARSDVSGVERRNSGQDSHNAWLRELEKAQSAMRHLDDSGQPERESAPGNQDNTGGSPAQAFQHGKRSVSDAAFLAIGRVRDASVPEGASGGSGVLLHAQVEGATQSMQPMAAVGLSGRLAQPLEASSSVGDVAGYSSSPAVARYATSAMSLMSAGNKLVNVAVRDGEMTLESELRLSQTLKSNLRDAGFEMGQLWLNGRAVYQEDSGSNHGN